MSKEEALTLIQQLAEIMKEEISHYEIADISIDEKCYRLLEAIDIAIEVLGGSNG